MHQMPQQPNRFARGTRVQVVYMHESRTFTLRLQCEEFKSGGGEYKESVL